MSPRKRVLVADTTEAIRSTAETVLRAHGYEVIAVSNADRAREVLQYSRPDVLILSADLKGRDERPLYEKVQAEAETSAIPMLIVQPQDKSSLPYPDEIIVSRPLDPDELLQKVLIFSGRSNATPAVPANPLGSPSVDDALLDAALGLDKIDVTASEVMNRALGAGGRPVATPADKLIGMEHDEHDREQMSDSARVESLMIKEEPADGTLKRSPKEAPRPGTSNLEIMADQYGLTDPDALDVTPPEQTHDYDWFIKSMKEEADQVGKKPSALSSKPGPGVDHLHITDTAASLNPHTPVSVNTPSSGGKFRSNVGVEKFIDEFKQEIERLRSDEPEEVFVKDTKPSGKQDPYDMVWEETLEKVPPEQVRWFTKQLAAEIAERLAEKIVSKLDADKLLQLVKSEVLTQTGRKPKA